MAFKMKYDFYVPVVRQVPLDNVPLRNSSQNFSEEPMFIFFHIGLMKSIPIKWFFVGVDDFWIFYKVSKWPVLYDKCIRKSKKCPFWSGGSVSHAMSCWRPSLSLWLELRHRHGGGWNSASSSQPQAASHLIVGPNCLSTRRTQLYTWPQYQITNKSCKWSHIAELSVS